MKRPMKLSRKLLTLLLAGVLAFSASPLTAMADETAPEATAETATPAQALPTGAIDRQKLLKEAAREASEEALAEAKESRPSGRKAATLAASEYEHVAYGCSYTLTPNSDGDNTYSLLIGPGTDFADTVYTYFEDTPELSNRTDDDTPGMQDLITRIEVADGVKTIGEYSFNEYVALRSVKLPDTLTTIGKSAFDGCYCLQELEIPNSVTSIGESALNDTCLTPDRVRIPSGCPASKGGLARAKVFYNVGDGIYVNPDASPTPSYLTQFQESYNKITEILNSLGVADMTRDIDKIQAIYDWVTSNVNYDYKALDYQYRQDSYGKHRYYYSATAHSCLFAHQGICSGYADLTKTMLKEAGIRCVECSGMAEGGGAHAWLLIEAGGIWYQADSTWDAGFDPGDYSYFLLPYANFKKHILEMDKAFYEVYPIKDPDYGKAVSGSVNCHLYGDQAAVTGYSGTSSAITLPKTVEYNGTVYPVTGVKSYAFQGNKALTSVVIPDGYEILERDVFDNCPNLTKITIPLSLKYVGGSFSFNYNSVITINGTYAQVKNWPLLRNIFTGYGMEYVMCKDKKIPNPFLLSNAKISIPKNRLVYNGKKQMPALKIVAFDGVVLRKDKDYKVSVDGESGAKIVDEYYIDIEGLGDYSTEYIEGIATFCIYPQPTTLKKLKRAKKAMTITWNKKTAQVGGYQIQYALNSSFTKGKKTVNVKKNTTTSLKVKKLKKKKTYYVRIRTYKKAPSTDENLYSTWSPVKKVKIK